MASSLKKPVKNASNLLFILDYKNLCHRAAPELAEISSDQTARERVNRVAAYGK
jgi:hypothetical protein